MQQIMHYTVMEYVYSLLRVEGISLLHSIFSFRDLRHVNTTCNVLSNETKSSSLAFLVQVIEQAQPRAFKNCICKKNDHRMQNVGTSI